MRAYCYLSKQQALLYEKAVGELADKIENSEGIERKGLVLSYLMRFKQICNHPAQSLTGIDYDATQSGKFERLSELCEEIAARQEKVLVFTQFKEMTEPLEQHLATVFGRPGLILHGGTAVKKRQELVEQFQCETGNPIPRSKTPMSKGSLLCPDIAYPITAATSYCRQTSSQTGDCPFFRS